MAMLMTPARSQITPARAPKTSGVASRTVPGSGLVITIPPALAWSA